MKTSIVYLEAPVNIHEIRKTYSDDVEFVTDTATYPNVVGIRYDGQLHKAIRGKLAGKSVKERVDRLLELYKRRLFKFWDEHTEELVSKVVSAGLEKGGPGSGCQGPNCGRPTTSLADYHEMPGPKFDIQDLRPTVRYKGKLYHGNKGETHAHTIDRYDSIFRSKDVPSGAGRALGYDWVNIEEGFTDTKNPEQFISRRQASQHGGEYLAEELRAAQERPKRNYEFVNKMEKELSDISELLKGGSGSGCHGPNCGRPKLGALDVHTALRSKADGTIFAGKYGDTHRDVYTQNFGIEDGTVEEEAAKLSQLEQGFVDTKGNWIPRDQLQTRAGIRGESTELFAQQITAARLRDEDVHDEGYARTIGRLIGKADEPIDDEDGETKKKRAVIAAVLAGLGASLADNALGYYKQAYLLGKERGLSISGEDFKAALTDDEVKRIAGLTEENRAYLDNFMADLEDRYVKALQTEYQSREAMEDAIRRITQSQESRLGMYAFAALGALALGFTGGVAEGGGVARQAAIDSGVEPPDEVTGMIWVTAHDDMVCAGCADNDGKFFTMDEFEGEYQNNECLVRCRCAETSQPTTSPPEHFGKSQKFSALRKGGPGSGSWDAPGQPRFAWSPENQEALRAEMRDVGIDVDNPKRQGERDTIARAKERIERHGAQRQLDSVMEQVSFKEGYLSSYGTAALGEKDVVVPVEHPVSDTVMKRVFVVEDMDAAPGSSGYGARGLGRRGKFVNFVKSGFSRYPSGLQDMIASRLNMVGVGTLPGDTAGIYDPAERKIMLSYSAYHGFVPSSVDNEDLTGEEEMPNMNLAYTHELAHALDHSFESKATGIGAFSESGAWVDAMQSGLPITEYAKSDPQEYFAESVVAYMYVPDKLKAANAKAYEVVDGLFKKHVMGVSLTKVHGVADKGVILDSFKGSIVELLSSLQGADVHKGGPGSGCKGPNCGRPSTGAFKIASGYPDSFMLNHEDPVSTRHKNGGKSFIDKFVVTPRGEFIPVLEDQRHGGAIGDMGSKADYGKDYDASIRVVQDLPRKVALIRIAHPDQRVVNAAVIDGDERAMNQILEHQRGVADKLYGKHKGMTVILASGGTWRVDQNELPKDLDNGYQLPAKPQGYVNAKFIHRIS